VAISGRSNATRRVTAFKMSAGGQGFPDGNFAAGHDDIAEGGKTSPPGCRG
jgi:hypothetical protein